VWSFESLLTFQRICVTSIFKDEKQAKQETIRNQVASRAIGLLKFQII
jgi:hypothetical protein